MRGRLRFSILIMVTLVLFVLGAGVALAAGPYHGTWADSPDWGYQNWVNYSTTIKWYPTFMWSSHSPPTGDRRIELELYDPASGNFCDRLEPVSLVEVGGDWIDSWSATNECGSSTSEQALLRLKESNLVTGTYYQAQVTANKIYTAGYGGETNISFTCWLCSDDDWLGKQTYDANYVDTGSDP